MYIHEILLRVEKGMGLGVEGEVTIYLLIHLFGGQLKCYHIILERAFVEDVSLS